MNRQTASQTHREAPTASLLATGILQRKCDCGNHTVAGGECSGCSKDRESVLQRSAISHGPANGSDNSVPPIVHEVLNSPGQLLDRATRAFMEPRFGHDFSRVRVHTDARAAESARAVSALAYTVGYDVVFASEQYAPFTTQGQRLLAHELTHTIQQSTGDFGAMFATLRIGDPGDEYERQAEAQADRVMSAEATTQPPLHGQGTAGRLQRAGDPKEAQGISCPIASNSPQSVIKSLLFATGATSLSAAQKLDLDSFVVSWRALGGNTPVRVDGFASIDGSQRLNWQLSCSRAQSVVAELLSPSFGSTAGIPSSQIQHFAQGETSEFAATAAPNRRATVDTPAPLPPPGPCTPPPCPAAVPGHQLRNPGIPSGSLCRGACGADCDPDACTAQPNLVLCLSDPTGACHRSCTYAVLECGSHQACRDHDACYDRCAVAGETGLCNRPCLGGTVNPCHCACDEACCNVHGRFTCATWSQGQGPQPDRLRFTDPPTASGPSPGPCGP